MLVDGTVLGAVVAAPALVALGAFLARGRAVRALGRLGVLVAGAGFLTGVVLVLRLSADGDVVRVEGGVISLAAERLSAMLLLLVFGVSAVVQAFATRYLAGDRRAGWFIGGAGLLTAASAALATAATLVALALAWTLAGVALCLLLGTYRHLPAARDGLRRTATAFVIGDAALWSAVALVTARWGQVRLDELAAHSGGGLPAAVVAVLIVVAALSRSAQLPFHRWLPATLAAPTPVSALLHAGVVNAGGILLIRLSPLSTADPAVALTLLAGAATMGYGALLALVKPDVKGALAYSTMAQMGFMMFTVGLGLWAAALIHLVAHGFYKATLFLSSGSAIAYRRRMAAAPPASVPTGRRRAAALWAVALSLAALAVGVTVVPGVTDHGSGMALLVFAGITGAAATWGWLMRRPTRAGVLTAAAVLTAAMCGYLGVVSVATTFLTPALPAETLPPGAVATVVAVAVLMLAGLAVLRRWQHGSGLHHALYAHALSASHPTSTVKGTRP